MGARTIKCPSCGFLVQSKFANDGEKPTMFHQLSFCPCCGVELKVVRNKLGAVVGAERVNNGSPDGIPNVERKRTAANLRRYLKQYKAPDWRTFCNIILGEGRLDGLRKAQAFDRLADLIDVPTTGIVERDGRAECACCGASYLCMREASFCPDCGAEVIR